MGLGRSFIILNKEDEKYCENGATGYCKIESQTNKTKIKVYVQSLKQLEAGRYYSIYLACIDDKRVAPLCLGKINWNKKNCELDIEVKTEDVLLSGIAISNFNMVIVCVKDDEHFYGFPLVGFHNIPKTVRWRSMFLQQSQQNIEYKTKKQESPSDSRQPERREAIDTQDSNQVNFKYFKNAQARQIDQIMSNIKGAREHNPFAEIKLKYKWWEISNLQGFENIYKSDVISNQIFKHPLIKKMLREANHFIFGAVSDNNDRMRYIAYGFPAKYSMKDQIYVGGFSNFYPVLGHNKSNGVFGYWVVHIRMDTDSIVMTV